jgi:predicted MFS family arabinose efflux permease
MIVLAFNSVDRLALGLLLQNIKVDLHLSDTQLGFLTGIAFALFYSVMGIPIARWADRGNRVKIITITTAIWSAAVCLCALASNFVQLLLIRVGVAVGEAGCIPPAHSLIADHFTRAERPRAVAHYMLGGPLSAVIGFFVAGWLNELYGWRMTFAILGAPGLVIAALAWLTLRDPRASSAQPAAETASAAAQPSMREVFVTLWANKTFRHLLLCFSVKSFFTYGIAKWQPAFFIRTHGLETGELGTWLSVIYGLGGLIGTYCGGEWASRRAASNERLQLGVMALLYCAFAVIFAFVYLTPNHYVAFGLLAIAIVGMTMASAPLFATLQTLVPDHMRAVSIAIIYLFANLIGMGLGPLVAGILSDAFRPWAGEESLRYALLALSPAYLWGAWHLWRASKTVTRDLAARQLPHEEKSCASEFSRPVSRPPISSRSSVPIQR